jgi:hypothetical protein
LYATGNRRRVALATTSISSPTEEPINTPVMVPFSLALYTKPTDGRCLTHIGREGWALSRLSLFNERRREYRERLNAVLAELLVIRHGFLTQPAATDPIGMALEHITPAQRQALGAVPTEAREIVGRWIAALIPAASAAEERFERAVAALARVDPVLSCWLSGKGFPYRFSVAWSSLARAYGTPGAHIAAIQRAVADEIKPDLDEAILEVAHAAGGWRARRRMRRILRQTPRPADEVRADIERLLDALSRAFETIEDSGEPRNAAEPSP